MDTGSSQTRGATTTSNTGTDGTSPPTLIWVVIPVVIVLLTGALVAILYRIITRCRRRKKEGDDPERAAGIPEMTTLEVGDETIIGVPAPPSARHGTRHHTMSDPSPPRLTDRWRWTFEPDHTSRAAARSTEGLNELGEAPPPYGENNERPKSYTSESVEAGPGSGGEGRSGVVPWQEREPLRRFAGQRLSGNSEPPAYEMTVGTGEIPGSSSIREPPPAVTPRPR